MPQFVDGDIVGVNEPIDAIKAVSDVRQANTFELIYAISNFAIDGLQYATRICLGVDGCNQRCSDPRDIHSSI